MVEKLKEVVRKIIKDERSAKEFGKLKTLKEVYEKCMEFGYESSYEEFKKDYNQIVYGLCQEIPSESLEAVSGGTMNKKLTKATAAILSALTLSTTTIPQSSAAEYNGSASKSSNSIINFIKENPGKSLLIALGAAATATSGGIMVGKIVKHVHDKNKKNNNDNNNTDNNNNSKTQPISPKEIKDNVKYYISEKSFISSLGFSTSFPKDSIGVCNHLRILDALRESNLNRSNYFEHKNFFLYIYMIYNKGNVDIQSITDGIKMWCQTKKNDSNGKDLTAINIGEFIAFADFLNFINTTNKIKYNDRKNRINQFLIMRMEYKILERVSNVAVNKTLIEQNIDIDKFFKHNFNIRDCFEIEVRPGFKETVSKEKLLKDFKESNLIIREMGTKIGNIGKVIKKYPISKIDNIFPLKNSSSYVPEDYNFAFFVSPDSNAVLDFSNKDWSRGFRPRNDFEEFFVNKKSNLVIVKRDGSYRLYTIEDVNHLNFYNVSPSQELEEFMNYLNS